MRLIRSVHATAFVVFLVAVSASYVATAQSSVEQRPRSSPITTLEKTALSGPVFIENVGQFDPKVKFQVKIGSQAVWLTKEGIVFDATRPAAAEKVVTADPKTATNGQDPLQPFALKRARPESRIIDRLVFSEDFVGASCCSKVEGKTPQEGVYNYFQGHDPKEWRTNVRGYAEVVYRDVWPGVDLRVYANGPDLEQEFILQPGADLTNVRMAYRGIDKVGISPDGSLEVNTAFGKLRETKPRLYQQIAGRRIAVDGRFKLTGDNAYSFEIGAHEAEYTLVIDPTLLYSTFLGGTAGSNAYVSFGSQLATGIAVDSSGNAYVVGNTASTDFPTTQGAFQANPTSGINTFISKLNSTGSGLVYSTYFGLNVYANGIAVDGSGDAYITGTVGSNTAAFFPSTANAYWPTNSTQHCASTDFFLTELNPTGSQLLYSSCFNAAAIPNAIALDTSGRPFIAGSVQLANLIPTTANAYQSTYPGARGSSAFAMIIDTTQSGAASLSYSTYFGIPSSNFYSYGVTATAIAVDAFGDFYITGSAGDGLPVTAGAFQTSVAGGITCNP